MQFADPQQTANAYLILRHLYDGDVIEWPIAEDHPLRSIFVALEQSGEIARWDRMWPLHDRYRLTEAGIAAIEAVYKPAGSDAVWNDLRARGLTPAERRAYLQQQGYDPTLWPLLHDPSTNWDTYDSNRGLFWAYIWEDQSSRRWRHRSNYVAPLLGDDEAYFRQHGHYRNQQPTTTPYLVDLDREAQASAVDVAPLTSDYEVS